MTDTDPSSKDPLQKYLDAGIAFTNLTRARAEKLVSELAQSGEFRGDARAKVDELIERSRKSQEALFAQVRHEVDRQLEHLGITNLEDLAKQVAVVIGRTAEAGRSATGGRTAAKKGATKKKATAKKASAKKTTAKKGRGQEVTGEELGGHQGGQEGRRPPEATKQEVGGHQGDQKAHGGGPDSAQDGRLTGRARRRLDRALVDRGLVGSRPRAAELIQRGLVLVSGTVADKPSRLVRGDEPIELLGPPPRFVSRGGEKLAAALERFAIDPLGAAGPRRRRLDRGVHRLPAPGRRAAVLRRRRGPGPAPPPPPRRLPGDGLERTDIRDVTLATVGGPAGRPGDRRPLVHLARRAVPALVGGWPRPGAPVVVLVKPQFEAGRAEASRGGGSSGTRASTGGPSTRWPPRSRPPERHHGGHGIAHHRPGRQRRVPAPRPCPGRRPTGRRDPTDRFPVAPCSTARVGRGRTGPVRRGLTGPVAAIAFYAHPAPPEAPRWPSGLGMVGRPGPQPVLAGAADVAASVEGADLLVSLGGDGTMLRTVDAALAGGIPVLGVNLGRLGYLTQVEPAGLEEALTVSWPGDYEVEERMTLEVDDHRAATATEPAGRTVLNEAGGEDGARPHRPHHHLHRRAPLRHLRGRRPARGHAHRLDRLQPVGPRTHPEPRLRAIVRDARLTAHALRPAPRARTDQWLRLEVVGPRAGVLVVDGVSVAELEPGDAWSAGEGEQPARLVSFGDRDFHAILRARFHLADR